MRKRLMALLLLMALAAACLPASAEEADPPAEGFRFSFTLHLNRDALSPALQDHAEGYAELLDALRFEGTWAHAVSAELFELRLSVIPLHPDASPVDLRFYGKPDYVYVTSPLLGEERVVLSNDSLLEFCAKAYEHLGVPLQYAALLLPYTWEAALKLPAEDWKAMADTKDAGGVISSEAVARLSESWASRVASDRALEVLSTSLGLDTGLDGAVQAIFSEVPAYLLNQVTGGEEIRVRRQGAEEIWSSACGDFAFVRSEPELERLTVSLPPMASGYLPSLSAQRVLEGGQQSGQWIIRILSAAPGVEDLLDLQVSAASLPVSWPADCSSLMHLSLTGGLFANVGFSAYLRGNRSGDLTAEIRKPSSDGEPGPAMLTLTGSLVPAPEITTVPDVSWGTFRNSTDVFRANDSSLSDFVSRVVRPLASGVLKFLIGVPASSCQIILDDLTDAGILHMLLGS